MLFYDRECWKLSHFWTAVFWVQRGTVETVDLSLSGFFSFLLFSSRYHQRLWSLTLGISKKSERFIGSTGELGYRKDVPFSCFCSYVVIWSLACDSFICFAHQFDICYGLKGRNSAYLWIFQHAEPMAQKLLQWVIPQAVKFYRINTAFKCIILPSNQVFVVKSTVTLCANLTTWTNRVQQFQECPSLKESKSHWSQARLSLCHYFHLILRDSVPLLENELVCAEIAQVSCGWS